MIIKEGKEKIKATSLDRLKADLKTDGLGYRIDSVVDQERPDLVVAANRVSRSP